MTEVADSNPTLTTLDLANPGIYHQLIIMEARELTLAIKEISATLKGLKELLEKPNPLH